MTEKETQRDHPSASSCPNSHNDQICACLKWESGASSGSAILVKGPKAMRCLPLLSQAISREPGQEVEQLGFESVPIWDAAAASFGLITVLSLFLLFSYSTLYKNSAYRPHSGHTLNHLSIHVLFALFLIRTSLYDFSPYFSFFV